MSNGIHRELEPYQVVSDPGQLQAFVDPIHARILRILQQREATRDQLREVVGESKAVISEHVQALRRAGLVKVVGERVWDGVTEEVYRSSARLYALRPDPGEIEKVAMPLATSMVDSIGQEILTSFAKWPDQRMNYEGRRVRMSYERAMEFDEKLQELVAEYWGDPDHPIQEDARDPLLTFVGLWFRSPEET